MKNTQLYRSIFSIALPLLFLLLLYSQWPFARDCAPGEAQELIEPERKQRGAHIFGIVDSTDFQPFHQNNLEWVTLVSWAFQDDYDSPQVSHHNGDSVYMAQHDAHWIARIKQVRAAGFKVFFKPHLWLDNPSDGAWRPNIFPNNEDDWAQWQETYRHFILRYAKVAEQAQAEMYCIGVEFSRLALEKPEFWVDLIQDIRSVYSGKLTYAANWYKEYEEITFWNELDYIGVQAYFPLVDHENPSLEQATQGWGKFLPALAAVHERFDRNILFTELGYRSTTSSGMRPWEWFENPSELAHLYSAETQANCYQAFFDTIWNQEWFAGVHIWQLRPDLEGEEEAIRLDFFLYNKPALQVVATGFE